MNYFFATLLSVSGTAMVYSGLAFLNGYLYPQLLAQIYTVTESMWLRLPITLVIFMAPANVLIAKSYAVLGPTIAGAIYIVFVVIGMVTMAMLVDGVKLNSQIIAGTFLAIAGCLLVVNGIKPV